MFHTQASHDSQGEVDWKDFLHAMTAVGFAAEKLYGSVWHFTPTDLDASRSIHVHEPHPTGKIPFYKARSWAQDCIGHIAGKGRCVLPRTVEVSKETWWVAANVENDALPHRGWSRSLKELHHGLSTDMLDNLALPFLIAASSCMRSNIRKTLAKEAKFLEIHIAPPLGVLRFDLDFRNGVLRRIIDRHSSHNSARGIPTNTSNDRRAVLQQMEEEKRSIGDMKTNMQAQASKDQSDMEKAKEEAQTIAEDLEKRTSKVLNHLEQCGRIQDLNVRSAYDKDYQLPLKAGRVIWKPCSLMETEWKATQKSLEERIHALMAEFDTAKATATSFEGLAADNDWSNVDTANAPICYSTATRKRKEDEDEDEPDTPAFPVGLLPHLRPLPPSRAGTQAHPIPNGSLARSKHFDENAYYPQAGMSHNANVTSTSFGITNTAFHSTTIGKPGTKLEIQGGRGSEIMDYAGWTTRRYYI
ncbi:hypothetical protein LTS15_001104 [Exophiala xenobiotica]|nr:hypothetical protein LTS15_001104 [Exophiala xenobiotica]